MKNLILILYILPSILFANICDKHPIYCQIIKNKQKVNEKINYKYAMKLSNSIYKVCRKVLREQTKQNEIDKKSYLYKSTDYITWKNFIDCEKDMQIYTAILAQESRYQLNATNCIRGLDKTTHEETTVCIDFGISQVNLRNIIKYDLDTRKLLTDIDYSVEQGIWILAKFKNQYYDKEDNYWSRYNASSHKKRKIYEDLVSRFF